MKFLKTHKKLIIVAIAAFIIGSAVTKIGYMSHKRGYMKGGKDEGKCMMYSKGKDMGMHQMPDGSMMGNMPAMNMDMMMQGMVANMKGKTGKDLEKAFLTDMIPHHQGAVEMAKMLVADTTVSAELRAFAQQIITAQEGEIEKMGVWVKSY